MIQAFFHVVLLAALDLHSSFPFSDSDSAKVFTILCGACETRKFRDILQEVQTLVWLPSLEPGSNELFHFLNRSPDGNEMNIKSRE
jgi:hypothetical protein